MTYTSSLGATTLSEITPLMCSSYAQVLKEKRGKGGRFSVATFHRRLAAIELLFEVSQFTDDSMPLHPWPETSADHMSGYSRNRRLVGNTTPLMSDEVYVAIFQTAWTIVRSAETLLDLRDELDEISRQRIGKSRLWIHKVKGRALAKRNWSGGNLMSFTAELLTLRDACFVVVASLSGCRSHELAFLRADSYYSTEDDQGERYWWMRSTSTKTDEGATEWMIPEAAVVALRVMDRWSAPYRTQLLDQIEALRAANPTDVRIADAQEHVDAIFVGGDKANDNQVRTLTNTQINDRLKAFARRCGLDWPLATHQFRRKFANYAARSRFGDLRYLKEHFKHWSLDMTLGYGLNESQEMALYLEIEDELENLKHQVVSGWMNKNEPLAGGYGLNLAAWREREENITLFKDHAHMIRSIASSTAIRSNGHAWCTADDNLCEGNDIDPTRCGNGCSNAVVSRHHAAIYVGLFNELKTLEDCEDIGEGGRKRVARDLERCRSVLTTLGHDPLEPVPA